jgi:hypothetical protein
MNSKQRRQLHRLVAEAEQMQSPSSNVAANPKEPPQPALSKPKPSLPQGKWSQRRKAFLKRIGLPSTIVGIVTMFFSFFPHLTLSEPTMLDETEFFSKSMTITNDGILPVFAIRCGAGFGQIMTVYNSGIKGLKDRSVHLMFAPCNTPRLFPGDAYSFSLEDAFTVKAADVSDADFDVVVSYIPLFPPVRMDRCTHFVLHKDHAGKQYWFRSPGQCALFPWLVSKKTRPEDLVP